MIDLTDQLLECANTDGYACVEIKQQNNEGSAMENNTEKNEISSILGNNNKNQRLTEFYERSSMDALDTKQESTIVDTLNAAVLSYEYEQAGFSIDLMKRSVLIFNTVLNSTFLYPYGRIREINYSLPANEFDDAEICILTDDKLSPSWKFIVPVNAHTYEICERWIDIFNYHIFCSFPLKAQYINDDIKHNK